jgi:hypothetical protein
MSQFILELLNNTRMFNVRPKKGDKMGNSLGTAYASGGELIIPESIGEFLGFG